MAERKNGSNSNSPSTAKRPLSTFKILTDEHYKCIGKIAAEWTYVELDIQIIIWHMAELIDGEKSKIAHAMTNHLGSETRIEILKTLVHNKTGDSIEYKQLCKFLDSDLKDLRTLRNEIIHGLYYRSPEFPDVAALYKVRAKGRLKFDFIQRSVSEMETIAQQIADLRDRLDQLPVWRHALPSRFVGPNR